MPKVCFDISFGNDFVAKNIAQGPNSSESGVDGNDARRLLDAAETSDDSLFSLASYISSIALSAK